MCVCVFTCKFLLEVVRVHFLQIFTKRIKSAYSLKSKFLQIFTGKVNEQTYSQLSCLELSGLNAGLTFICSKTIY